VAVAMEEGLPLAILPVDERDPEPLRRALGSLLQRLGVEVLVTDDLVSYRLLAEGLGLRHQVCSFHLLRRAGRELGRVGRELGQEWAPMLARVRGILKERPPSGR
jgi:hypothetical protein